MLVRFKSDVGGFTMFGDVAVKLLRMTGHSGTVPGAIPAAEVPAALERLRAALEGAPGADDSGAGNDDAEREPPVTLRQRAWPLQELLQEAAREQCGLMWEKP
jgi:hypothetical protein